MPEENNEKIEEQDEPLKVPEPEPIVVKPIDHTKSSNIDDDLGNQFTKTQKDDLTDAGETTLHKHDTRYLYKENTIAFTPDADYEPSTKKYVDDKLLVAAGDVLVASADTENTIGVTSYTKYKEFTANRAGTYRIKFSIKGDIAPNVTTYGRIYKGGVAYGTERSVPDDTWTEFSEDLAFVVGDKIQLYCREASLPSGGAVKACRLYISNPFPVSIDLDI